MKRFKPRKPQGSVIDTPNRKGTNALSAKEVLADPFSAVLLAVLDEYEEELWGGPHGESDKGSPA